MIIGNIMDQVGEQLDTIPGLRVRDYDADEIQVPAGIVSLPTGDINYHGTYQDGMKRLTLTVIVLVAADGDRVRRDQITPYADTTGPKSITQILERGSYTAFDIIAVKTGRFGFYTYNKIKYLGIAFSVDISGS
jgi:hypothetical protein